MLTYIIKIIEKLCVQQLSHKVKETKSPSAKQDSAPLHHRAHSGGFSTPLAALN